MEAALHDLAIPSGHSPGRAALASAMGVTPGELDDIRARSASSMVLSLDDEDDGDGVAPRDLIVDVDRATDPASALERRELLSTLLVAAKMLPGANGEVIRRHNFERERLEATRRNRGVTHARVSGIRAEAVTSLRACFASVYEDAQSVPNESPAIRVRSTCPTRLASEATKRVSPVESRSSAPGLNVDAKVGSPDPARLPAC